MKTSFPIQGDGLQERTQPGVEHTRLLACRVDVAGRELVEELVTIPLAIPGARRREPFHILRLRRFAGFDLLGNRLPDGICENIPAPLARLRRITRHIDARIPENPGYVQGVVLRFLRAFRPRSIDECILKPPGQAGNGGI